MHENGIVLAYELPPEKEALIKELCASLSLGFKIISPSDYNKSLGYLASINGIPAIARQEKPAQALQQDTSLLRTEMLVFSGMAGPLLDHFLAAYKDRGISPVYLKAILTPSNISWSSYALSRELMLERTTILQKQKDK